MYAPHNDVSVNDRPHIRRWNHNIIYDMIYLLTATGLSHGGSSTVHIYTQTIHRTTKITTEQHK